MTESERTNEWVWPWWAALLIGVLAARWVSDPPRTHDVFWLGAYAALTVIVVFRALIACIRLGRTSSGGEA